MDNPIPKSNLFTTPADVEHLVTLLNSCGTKEEQCPEPQNPAACTVLTAGLNLIFKPSTESGTFSGFLNSDLIMLLIFS